MTNREKLNAMTDEELQNFFCDKIEWLHEHSEVDYDMCEPCPFKKYCRYKHNGFLHWLEMEAEEDDAEEI